MNRRDFVGAAFGVMASAGLPTAEAFRMESNRAVFFCLQPEGFLSGTWTVIHYAQPDPSADGTTLHVYYFSKGGGPWNFPIEDAHEVFVRFPNDTGRKFGADDSDISILRRLSPSEYKL